MADEMVHTMAHTTADGSDGPMAAYWAVEMVVQMVGCLVLSMAVLSAYQRADQMANMMARTTAVHSDTPMVGYWDCQTVASMVLDLVAMMAENLVYE